MSYQNSVTKVVSWITDVKAALNNPSNTARLKYLMDHPPSEEDLNYLGAEPEIRSEYQKVLRKIAVA